MVDYCSLALQGRTLEIREPCEVQSAAQRLPSGSCESKPRTAARLALHSEKSPWLPLPSLLVPQQPGMWEGAGSGELLERISGAHGCGKS